MRRTLLTLAVALLCASLAQPASAQFKFGVQGASITSVDAAANVDLGGTFGLGGRVMLDPPLFPLALVGGAVYYFPDCTVDCSFWTASIVANLRLPTPIASPYILGGWQTRRAEVGGVSNSENGPVLGIGLQVNLVVSIFLEATMELNDEIPSAPDFDNDPIVIKGGILIG